MDKLTVDELKQLHAILQPDVCWHEITRCKWDGYDMYESYCSCGRGPYNSFHERGENELFGLCGNPTYDNPAIIAELMKSRGLWDEFVVSLKEYEIDLCKPRNRHFVAFADILTAPALLGRAIIAWRASK